MNRHALIKSIIACGWLGLLTAASAAPNAAAHTYPSGAVIAGKIARDLYATLEPQFQRNLDPEAMAMEQAATPVITPIGGSEDRRVLRQVSVSAGYLDLINHIAHAKAIDRIQPGFFQQYVLNLARQSGVDGRVEAPNMVDARYWRDDVMNDQISFFNQMVSMTMAISLSHHYLGHYNKYASQMLAGKLVPINHLMAPVEWEASVKCATLNSMDCALGTEGARALFDFIDQMPRRPAWAEYIVPQGVNIKMLNRELSDYENDYFRGGLKLRASPPAVSVVSIQNGMN